MLAIFSTFLSIFLSKIVFSNRKSKLLNYSSKKITFFYSKKLKSLEDELNRIDNPYGFNSKRFFFLKYFISILMFFLIFIRTKNFIISTLYFFVIYFIPDFLIKKFQKKESIKIIREIKTLTNNLVLLLAANVTFYDALKIASNSIKYSRFKNKFIIFIEDYSLYNFNLKPAIEKFKKCFKSEEFDMFNNIIIQGNKEGKMLEMLEVFEDTLELSMYKYAKQKERKVSIYILIASIISLVNITIITVYPMIVQIFRNLNLIFK